MNIHADLVLATTMYSASECVAVAPSDGDDAAPQKVAVHFKSLSPEQQAAWRSIATHFRSYVGPGDTAKINLPNLVKSLKTVFPFITRPDAAAVAAVNMAPLLFDEIS